MSTKRGQPHYGDAGKTTSPNDPTKHRAYQSITSAA